MGSIIPKPIKKTPRIYKFIPYIVFSLVLVVISVYITLLYIGNKASETLLDLEEKIAQVGTKDEKTIEARVLLDKQKIDDFSNVFADHKKASNFFKFLEENCHPKIWFNEFKLSSQDSQVVLAGETSNFETLGQQIVIFQSHELVEKIDVSDLTIGKSGLVNFTFSISLNPEIFKNNEPR